MDQHLPPDEFRSLGTLSLEGRKIIGTAIPYDCPADLGNGISEVIRPGAVADLLRSNPRIVALKEHDPHHVLGSTASGTLKLIDTPTGLNYEITPPDTTYATDLLRTMEANPGTYGASFHMRLEPKGYLVQRQQGGGYLRTIQKIAHMREITVTAFPCYPDSTAMLRSLQAAVQEGDTGAVAALLEYLKIRARIGGQLV